MARRKKGRPLHGILVVDKPRGISSSFVVNRLKRRLNAQKAGHTGALDPMATGVLPVVLGEASKYSQYGLDADKAYEATIQFGQATSTLDADGEVIEEVLVQPFDAERIEIALARHRGAIEQLPPLVSALKQDGRRWYDLARQGVEIERTPRPVEIYELTLTHYDAASHTLSCFVRCSKGTYIRSLAESIAKALGTLGHLSALRRVDAGGLTLAHAHTLADCEARLEFDEAGCDAWMLPIDGLVAHFPKIEFDANDCMTLIHGQKLLGRGQELCHTMRAYLQGGGFIGLVSADESGTIRAKRMLSPVAAGMRGDAGFGPLGSGMPDKE